MINLFQNFFIAVNLREEYAFGKSINSLSDGLQPLVQFGFTLAGVVLTIYCAVAGFTYLTSAGDKAAISKAQRMITHSMVGFILLMLMFLLLQFVPRYFGIDIMLIKE